MAGGGLRTASRLRVKDDVLALLREGILEGTFAPGEHLGEADLAERLQVSRGPVRDALSILAHEGLVIIEPHKGATVPLLSKEDVDEVYSLRLALETLAAKEAVRKATDADLDALSVALSKIPAAIESGDRRAVTDADLAFHEAFYLAAHHQRLYASWRLVRSQVSLCLFSRNTLATTRREIVVDEHARILDLLKGRETDELVAAVGEHLRGAYERLVQYYED
jgi:DNA-binding GntR family transcriptional regulator